MQRNNPARSFYSLLTLLAVLAGAVVLLTIAFNPENWLRQMRLSLASGIHSPLYSDYSADLRGVMAAPAELRLLQEAALARQGDPDEAINDLLTPVPSVTPRPGDGQPTLSGVLIPTTPGPTATLPPGVTPTLTWTPTLTQTFSWTQTARATQTPGATSRATNPPAATLTPTATASPAPTFTHTYTPQPTPSHTPPPTPTTASYPPPSTPLPPDPTEPAYP